MHYNRQRFNPTAFEKGRITNESVIANRQFDHRIPNFFHNLVTMQEVEDEIHYFQFGQFDHFELFDMKLDISHPSSWIDFPQRYKFTGVEILFDFNLEIVNRQTYDSLQLLGDVGGLQQGLSWIGIILVSWYSRLNYQGHLVSKLFTQRNKGYKTGRTIGSGLLMRLGSVT